MVRIPQKMQWSKEDVELLTDEELLAIQENIELGQELEVASASDEYSTSLLGNVTAVQAERSGSS
jgi:hypothetical protein